MIVVLIIKFKFSVVYYKHNITIYILIFYHIPLSLRNHKLTALQYYFFTLRTLHTAIELIPI